MNSTCPTCRATFSPNGGGHCRACCRTFTSDSAFDHHRTGPMSIRGCLPVEAMYDWRLTPRGWTDAAPMPADVLARKIGAAS